MRDSTRPTRTVWLRIAAVLSIAALVALAAWRGMPSMAGVTLQEFSDWFTPHRQAWYALPAVALAFVVLGLAMVPVLVLIAATGLAFGPVLGPIYAMAGCLASASIGFAIGRWTGLGRIERVGGTRAIRVVRSLERNGTLSVFLLRKIPAPFLVANIVAGASKVRYRDFVVGTVLGMGAGVVALAGFGYHIKNLLSYPTPMAILGAAVFVAIPLTVAWFINRTVRERGHAA